MSDPLREIVEHIAGLVCPREDGYAEVHRTLIEAAREALTIEPEYEWEIRARDGELLQHADSDEDAGKRVEWFGDSYAQRRIKAGPWERVGS